MAKLDLTALIAEVERYDTVEQSAAALLGSLFAELESAKGDPAAVQAVVDRFKAENDALVAAVAANTPAAPAPTPEPVPEPAPPADGGVQ